MKRVLKWLAFIVGGLIGLALLALGAVYFMSEARMNQTYEIAAEVVPIPADADSIAEGKRLYLARGCGDCHSPNGAGTLMIDDPLIGELHGANLTAGPGGIGDTYTDADWVRAIRHGIGADGKPLLVMPSQEFYTLNDRDLGVIIAYLKSLPAVEREVPAPVLGPLGRVLFVTGQIPLLPAELIDHEAPRPVAVEAAATVEYGAYVAQSCIGCHGAGLSGGPMPGLPPNPPYPANLTPDPTTGLGNWTEADFVQALRQGQRPDGTILDPVAMPWPNFGQMTDTELSALWLYLQSMPAKPYGNR